MPRLRQVPRAEASPSAVAMYDFLFGERDPVAEPGTATGTPGNWWTVFALVPDVLDHASPASALYGARSDGSSTRSCASSGRLERATHAAASSCSRSTASRAGRSGSPRTRSQAIPSYETADCFSPLERAVLAYTDPLVLRGGRVARRVFAALKEAAQRRADPRAHVHHLPVRDARHDEPRAAARVRRPRRSDRRDRGTDGRSVARHHARHQRCTGPRPESRSAR